VAGCSAFSLPRFTILRPTVHCRAWLMFRILFHFTIRSATFALCCHCGDGVSCWSRYDDMPRRRVIYRYLRMLCWPPFRLGDAIVWWRCVTVHFWYSPVLTSAVTRIVIWCRDTMERRRRDACVCRDLRLLLFITIIFLTPLFLPTDRPPTYWPPTCSVVFCGVAGTPAFNLGLFYAPAAFDDNRLPLCSPGGISWFDDDPTFYKPVNRTRLNALLRRRVSYRANAITRWHTTTLRRYWCRPVRNSIYVRGTCHSSRRLLYSRCQRVSYSPTMPLPLPLPYSCFWLYWWNNSIDRYCCDYTWCAAAGDDRCERRYDILLFRPFHMFV